MSTVKEMLSRADVDRVLNTLYGCFDGQGRSDEGYRLVVSKLLAMTPAYSDCTVHADLEDDDMSNSKWIHVYGTKSDSEETWALDLMPWSKWLGSEVDSALTDEEVLAGVLYEMTFFGFNEEKVNAERAALERIVVDDLDDGSDCE